MTQQHLVGQGLLITESSLSHWNNTLGRTPLEHWSARPLTDTSHNTHRRQASIPSAVFEPAIPACEQRQTHTFDRAVTETSYLLLEAP